MLIDLFTLAAQVANFLILVWLLKRFLWAKLIAAIDERESRIAARLDDADRKNKDAERTVQQMQARAEEQEHSRAALLAETQREANDLRLELMQRAREDVRQQEEHWREDLEREKTAFLEEARRRAGAEVLAIVKRALADLACADVQHCASEAFIERLQRADSSTLRSLAAGGKLTVLTSSDLPSEIRRRIEVVLAERLPQPLPLEFARNPGMSWGIELRSDGRSIGWTPDNYLQSLDEALRKALDVRPKALAG